METNNKDNIIKLRINTDEKEVLKELAQEKGMNLSQFILYTLYSKINDDKIRE